VLFDSIAFAIEPFGQFKLTIGSGLCRRGIELIIDPVAPRIEAVVNPLASSVQPVIDPITLRIEPSVNPIPAPAVKAIVGRSRCRTSEN
jgi:hypothetical protein